MRPFSHLIILRLTTLGVALLLAGCEIPGMGPDPKIAARLADGKAIGSACRHALRGIEDCYALNEKALKTAVFEGWKEMDQYMRDNKIDGIPSKAVKSGTPAEEIIEEKAVPEPPKDKSGGDSKPKPKAKPAAEKATH
jgi:hypothetical protein